MEPDNKPGFFPCLLSQISTLELLLRSLSCPQQEKET
uniref:Uncharacterized protein n=1 Tax=Physcomitrium patens TaxID=3218 RepID=A0A2K1JRX2_PHYPA|nr:hypothetical protein PHYPA_016668 [Physcomitrium patens]